MGIEAAVHGRSADSARCRRHALRLAADGIETAPSRSIRRDRLSRTTSPPLAMTSLENAVVQIAALFESEHIEYMIVGGIANAIWGEPRATIDVDVEIAVENADIDKTIGIVARAFDVAIDDP